MKHTPAPHGSTPPLLELRNLRISFSSVDAPPLVAVEDLNLTLHKREILALVGPSGCGKSTTLSAMAGLIPPDRGEVLLDGQPLRDVSTRIGYISQADSLLPWRCVLDNVALGLTLRHMKRKERHERARDLINQMGLNGFEDLYPHELSGGMKKRVTIARILAIEPELLFMDEPFAPLDAFTREKLQDDLLEIWERSGQSIVYVTHDLGEAIALADRVLLLGGRPGRVQGEYPIPLGRPRRVSDLQFNDAFVALERRIRADLRALLLREEAAHGD